MLLLDPITCLYLRNRFKMGYSQKDIYVVKWEPTCSNIFFQNCDYSGIYYFSLRIFEVWPIVFLLTKFYHQIIKITGLIDQNISVVLCGATKATQNLDQSSFNLTKIFDTFSKKSNLFLPNPSCLYFLKRKNSYTFHNKSISRSLLKKSITRPTKFPKLSVKTIIYICLIEFGNLACLNQSVFILR